MFCSTPYTHSRPRMDTGLWPLSILVGEVAPTASLGTEHQCFEQLGIVTSRGRRNSKVFPSPRSSSALSRRSGRAFLAINPPQQVFQNILLLAQPTEAQVWERAGVTREGVGWWHCSYHRSIVLLPCWAGKPLLVMKWGDRYGVSVSELVASGPQAPGKEGRCPRWLPGRHVGCQECEREEGR